jgi:hypothetical protein
MQLTEDIFDLRRFIGVFYPEHISNIEWGRRRTRQPYDIYTRTTVEPRTRPISILHIDIIKKRWTRLLAVVGTLGHTLRLPKETATGKQGNNAILPTSNVKLQCYSMGGADEIRKSTRRGRRVLTAYSLQYNAAETITTERPLQGETHRERTKDIFQCHWPRQWKTLIFFISLNGPTIGLQSYYFLFTLSS